MNNVMKSGLVGISILITAILICYPVYGNEFQWFETTNYDAYLTNLLGFSVSSNFGYRPPNFRPPYRYASFYAEVHHEIYDADGQVIDDIILATHQLNDLGVHGDYQPSDGNFECMYLSQPGTYTLFKVYNKQHNLIRQVRDDFNDNVIAPGSVSVVNDTLTPSLEWSRVEGADEYWLGIWKSEKNFIKNGYVDISQRVREFSSWSGYIDYDENTDLYSITLEGDFMQLPLGNYYWMVIAEGTGEGDTDGNSATGGLLRVIPEPPVGILFMLGTIFLVMVLRYKEYRKIL